MTLKLSSRTRTVRDAAFLQHSVRQDLNSDPGPNLMRTGLKQFVGAPSALLSSYSPLGTT